MEKGKKRNSRLNARFVLLFSVALMLVVMCTFGMTMAYFGGKSKGYTANFILKAGINFKQNVSGTDYQKLTFSSDVLIPGTTISSNCLITITSGTADVANTAVDGLLRVGFSLTGNMANFININYDTSTPIYVYKCTTEEEMIESNKVARLVQAEGTDTYFYLVSTDVTSIDDATELYEIPCTKNSGQVSLMFNLSFLVNHLSSDGKAIFNNDYIGKTAEFKADFTVIQSDFYDKSTTPLEKTYENAKPIFDEPTGASA